MAPPPSPFWRSGLCGCCADCDACCLSCCCPCVQFGSDTDEDNSSTQHGNCILSLSSAVSPLLVCALSQNMELVLGDSCVIQAVLYCITLHFGCCCIIHAPMRSKFRARYGIEGSACGDCCITSGCACCAIAQEAREIKARGVPPRMQMPGSMLVSSQPVVYAAPAVHGQSPVMYGQPR